MADYIVGDIQGCYTGLSRLLDSVSFNPLNDKLIAVGDLIGRGPQALETLEFLYSLGDQFTTVLGNHDLHFLAITCGVRKAKPNDKLDELLASPDLNKYVHWLRHKPLALRINDNTLVSHAGLYPQWSINKALAMSEEVCNVLQSDEWHRSIDKMYGNQPDTWDDSLTGAKRLRFIVNAFTRMRYMYNAQRLEFSCKGAPKSAPKTVHPWFEVQNPNLKHNESVAFGHWATLSGQTNNSQFMALDTGYIWQQSLTMWQVQNEKKYSIAYQV